MTFSRRDWLSRTGCGFGSLAFAGLNHLLADTSPSSSSTSKTLGLHHLPKAKRVIFIFMQGGVSHVDSFDYKPRLQKDDGKQLGFDDSRTVANSGQRGTNQRVMKPLWRFAQHGQSGKWASNLFPEMNRHLDDLCFVHSLHTEGVAHGRRRCSCIAEPPTRFAPAWVRGSLTDLAVRIRTCLGSSASCRAAATAGLATTAAPFCPRAFKGLHLVRRRLGCGCLDSQSAVTVVKRRTKATIPVAA